MIRFVRLLEVHLMTITNFILEKKKKKQLQIQGIRTVKCTWMANESARSANAKEREKCTTVHNHTLSFETIHVICFVFSFFFRSPKSISNEEISFSILTILVKSTFSNVITWTEPKDASRFLCLFHIDFWFLSNDYIVMWVFGWHDHKIAGCAGETDMLLWHGLSLACEIETLNESNHFYFRHICQFMARGRLLLPLFFCLFATPIVSILFRIRFALDVFVFLDLQRKTCSFRCDWMRVHQLFLCFFFSVDIHAYVSSGTRNRRIWRTINNKTRASERFSWCVLEMTYTYAGQCKETNYRLHIRWIRFVWPFHGQQLHRFLNCLNINSNKFIAFYFQAKWQNACQSTKMMVANFRR